MADNKNVKYIKTRKDLDALYDNRTSFLNGEDVYVFAHDFEDNILFASRYKPGDAQDMRLYQKLIDNTMKHNNKKQNEEFAGRLADEFKRYFYAVYQFGVQKWNPADLRRIAEYTPYEIIINHAARRGLFGMDNSFLFKKSISPENQILLNKSGFMGFENNYNFSGQKRFEDKAFVMTVLPKQTYGLYGNLKTLYEKFENDFGREFDPKTAFKNAENPYVLFELRSGKINPILAMPKLKSSDFKYIIPKHDFENLSVDEIYNMLSARNVKWEEWQVYSMMDLMVDKVPDTNNEAYLNQMMEIILVNKQLFMKDSTYNHKLWLKIEDKFKDAAKRNQEYIETLKHSIDMLRSEIDKKDSELAEINKKISYLKHDEIQKYNNVQSKKDSVYSEHTLYYRQNAAKVGKALDAALNGNFEKLSVPEKPWKIFGFQKEKQQYESLLDLIDSANQFIEYAKEKRDEYFGCHDFSHLSMSNSLLTKRDNLNKAKDVAQDDLNVNSNIVSKKRNVDVVKENADSQKDAKKARMENYQKKLKEKGVVLGQKSGMVKADEKARAILYNKAVRGIMKKLRATPANANKSDEELMTIAKKVLAEKQK